MFPGYPSTNGSGKIVGKLREDAVHREIVAEGWPILLEAMEAAQINTPNRVAAFLTTLVFESYVEYNILQGGSNVPTGRDPANPSKDYTGRGHIQLTGSINYDAAGTYFSINLIGHPELAQALAYSAKISTWYWTVRRHCNEMADAGQMGKVNRAIGYPLVGSNDADRCMVFGKAVKYLTGEVIAVDCTR